MKQYVVTMDGITYARVFPTLKEAQDWAIIQYHNYLLYELRRDGNCLGWQNVPDARHQLLAEWVIEDFCEVDECVVNDVTDIDWKETLE